MLWFTCSLLLLLVLLLLLPLVRGFAVLEEGRQERDERLR